MHKLSPAEEQIALYEEWMADPTSDDTKLQEFYNSPRSRKLSYLEKNRGFITGSKLETFKKDEWWYYLQFVEEMKMPYEVDTTYEPFAIGSAFDEWVTYGFDAMIESFVEVSPRIPDIDGAIEECERKLRDATNPDVAGMFKKDGSRSAKSITQEESANLRMEFLKSIVGKTQLTPANMELIRQMYKEWNEQRLFSKELKKKHIFFKLHGEIPIKAELDHHEPHFTNKELGAYDYFAVVDAKTTANIEKSVQFAKDNYLSQMSLYALLVEHAIIAKEEEDRQVCAIIQAVDKHGLWSRSAAIYFAPELLRDARQPLIERIEACWMAHKTGMFFKSDSFLPDCPYYGTTTEDDDWGYGRSRKFFIA